DRGRAAYYLQIIRSAYIATEEPALTRYDREVGQGSGKVGLAPRDRPQWPGGLRRRSSSRWALTLATAPVWTGIYRGKATTRNGNQDRRACSLGRCSNTTVG